MSRTVRLAYDLDGNNLPYESEDANVRLEIKTHGERKDSLVLTPCLEVKSDSHGLPFITYHYQGKYRTVNYMPKGLEERIRRDLEVNSFSGSLIYLNFYSEESAKAYAKMMEWWDRELPVMTDGKLLSTRMSY